MQTTIDVRKLKAILNQMENIWQLLTFFHFGGPYHVETSPLNCSANQWTGFYMIGTYIMKELNFAHLYYSVKSLLI